jgi:asparagine synthase (glutamine-hydrolysing)
MCGFSGFVGRCADLPVSEWEMILHKMGKQIAHRGPDDVGVWIDPQARVGIVHRRLSILDLSSAGHQPMVSVSNRFVIAFNGEIYNHLLLRKEVERSADIGMHGENCKFSWRGRSDTETLLAAIETFGLEATLKKCVGMFAIVLWDKLERALYLARDRMGEKPLYYGWQNGAFLFASELKALTPHPAFAGEINRDAIALQLRHNCVPAPFSIFKGIRKLRPGMYLRMSGNANQEVEEIPYWSLRAVANRGLSRPFSGGEAAALLALEAQLRESIALQMISDVPLGAFLSGGVDSSTVVALMQAQSTRPVKTFTIGFHEHGYNEAEYAKQVSKHLGTEHTELYVTPREAMGVIPELPTLYDEPFSDSSQIPTFLVSRMTRQHVKVSLSGDAGDELFGGYNRHFMTPRLARMFYWLPFLLRKPIAKVLARLSVSIWEQLGRAARIPQGPERARRAIEVLGSPNIETAYRLLTSHWTNPSEIVLGGSELATTSFSHDALGQMNEFEHQMMYMDAVSYLPDDVLVKVDRAAMAVSLETRVPFLDHRVVELAWSLPLSMKIRQGQGKWILRKLLCKYVPKALIDRPKRGFGVPIDAWLRGPLRDWAESLLSEGRLRRDAVFRHEPIRKRWHEHLSGRRNWQYELWDVLMVQGWLERWRA